ncbi:MAG: TonB-dependent receptor [Gemmatimonadetes bacterium]|nr:TonB-dependent receptor [Gemmatimonadota bacterium]MXX36259.1 TonB-dependent receptor [Gemmatimonadota bacterium]MYD12100.1 TonB-dependent receptor [Gemmatimonadota bacterium]MYI64756.1 TonB-dependent receptor [Gemmatimonadota bacterium]
MAGFTRIRRDARRPAARRLAAVWLVCIAAFALIIGPAHLAAQEPSTVAGTVSDAAGQPLAGADAFLLQTLEGSLTDQAGGFSFNTRATGPATVVVQKPGYLEVRLAVDLPLDGPLAIAMHFVPIVLQPITVEAGAFRLGNLPDVTLDDLEVVRTPGAAADPFRAIQTFPGLQSVGEGAGLFVRGGDISETRVLLDGATVISPFRLDTDRTISFGRFDPFQLRGIHFSAGGFGAEYGDALSAIADLRSVDRPTSSELGVTAAIGGVSGGLQIDLSESVGFRATATHSDTDLLMRLNGRRDEFDAVPRSSDLSGGGEWAYRDGGSLKVFALVQTDGVGVRIRDPSYSGVYRSDARADLFAVSGLDHVRAVAFEWGLATSGSRKDEDFGAFRLDRDDRSIQARARMEVPVRPGVAVAAGAEMEHRDADLAGSVPVASHDNAPNAATTVFSSRQSGVRLGGFGEFELQPSNALRVLIGLRTDRSTFTGRATVDPRLSATWRLTEQLTLAGAWGVFHQVPDPLLFEPTLGDSSLPAMSAHHWIGGATWNDGIRLVRVEAYAKRYAALAARTRTGSARGGGTGTARGFDVFVKEELGFLGLDGRIAYSFIRSERTDPDSGRLAPSPFDATHTLNLVLNRGVGNWLDAGVAYRAATGVPFTPVRDAAFDPDRGLWEPVYGTPLSERLPRYARIDLSASVLQSYWSDNTTVFFVSIMNSLDRSNVREYRYSRDYSERIPLETPFPRSIYFGVTTTLPF